MTELLLGVALVLLGVVVVLQILLHRRKVAVDLSPLHASLQSVLESVEKSHERAERSVRDEIAKNRAEASAAGQQARLELGAAVKGVADTLSQRLAALTESNDQKFEQVRETVEQRLHSIQQGSSEKLEQVRQDSLSAGKALREEVGSLIKAFGDTLTGAVGEMAKTQAEKLTGFGVRLEALTGSTDQKLDAMRLTIDEKMKAVQEASAKQLTEARQQAAAEAKGLREEIAGSLRIFSETTTKTMTDIAGIQKGQLEAFSGQLVKLTETNEAKLKAVNDTLEQRLAAVQEENRNRLDQMRVESSDAANKAREEVTAALKNFNESVGTRVNDLALTQKTQLENMQGQLLRLTEGNEKRLADLRVTVDERLKLIQEDSSAKLDQMRLATDAASKLMREELNTSLKNFNDSVLKLMTGLSEAQKKELEVLTGQLAKLTETNQLKLDGLKTAVEERLKLVQEDNAKQLELMRATVDEKLQGTLDKRLGESFKLVSDRLEQVHKGLGEMQTLATGVGDLKKVLSNVKTRGTWGEVQLGALLEQVLSPEQYQANVAPKDGGERVEFAVKMPGRSGDIEEIVWLPIDAKFPIEDYHRLVDAQEKSDAVAADAAGKDLEDRIKQCARDICDKYLNPPKTTDFAILFLPIEGLFAEVIRRRGLAEHVQSKCRVVIAGPTTLWSILNSLQMGFRTLAIQKRSGEVWNLLAAVKTEWTKYDEVLRRVQKKLEEASNTVETAATRTRAIGRRLRSVQELPASESGAVLMLEAVVADDAGPEEEAAP